MYRPKIHLDVKWNGSTIQFQYATKAKEWIPVEAIQDGSILSDDHVRDGKDRYRLAFTGAFVGLCCQDLTGHRQYADFEYFEYKEID